MERRKINEKDLHLNPEYSGEEAAKGHTGMGSPIAGDEAMGTIKCPITAEDGCEATEKGCNTRICPDKPSVDVCQQTERLCLESEDCPATEYTCAITYTAGGCK